MTTVEQAMRIPGSTNRIELSILQDLAKKHIKTCACEVGVDEGRSAYVIGNVCKQKDAGFFYVDVDKPKTDLYGSFVLGDSTKIHHALPDMDFVFIDGDHEMPTVFYDIINFWKKVKPGGILIGHDYRGNDSTSEVKVVVDNLKIMEGFRHAPGHSLWWKVK